MEYAKSQHFPNPTFFIDDGYSGVFAAGILGIPLIEPVLNACHVAVGAVGVNGVEVVVDGNIPHAVLRKRVVDIKPCQRGITTES